jgi:hypothetical protein
LKNSLFLAGRLPNSGIEQVELCSMLTSARARAGCGPIAAWQIKYCRDIQSGQAVLEPNSA